MPQRTDNTLRFTFAFLPASLHLRRIRCGFWFRSIFIHCSICFAILFFLLAFQITFTSRWLHPIASSRHRHRHALNNQVNYWCVLCAHALVINGMFIFIELDLNFRLQSFSYHPWTDAQFNTHLNRLCSWSNFSITDWIWPELIKRLGCRLPLPSFHFNFIFFVSISCHLI